MAYLYLHFWLPIFTVFNAGALALTDGFTREPTNQTVNSGETVTLHCTVNPPRSPYVYVYWYKSFGFSDNPSMPISSERTMNRNADSRYSIVGIGSDYNLQIRDVQVGDTSNYKCRYYNGNYFDSQIARLIVYDESLAPRCRYQPLNPEVGSMVYISCSPTSTSRVTLSLWRGVNGHQVTNLDRRSDGSIKYSFRLRENDNNRMYTCNYGRTYHDVHNCSVTPLNITPTITLIPGVNYGVPAGDIRFSCKASGVPVYSSYRWLVGLGPSTLRISESVGRYIFSTNGDSVRLTLIGLKLSDNNTAVRCVAVNVLGQRIMALGKMVVKIPPRDVITTIAPNILQSTTRGSFISKSISPTGEATRVTAADRREKAVWKSPLTEGVYPENTKQEHNKTEIQIFSNKSPNKRPSSVALPIILTLFMLFVVLAVIAFFIFIKKTNKAPPELLKRLSTLRSRPAAFKQRITSLKRPQFLERSTLRKSWQDAKQRVEALQKRATWGSRRTSENEEKRQSLRDQIEVVVNPPPPEWKLKVEDVTKAQRQRLISHHAPTGGYSAKEKDLLASLMTGTIQVKTLDKVEGFDVTCLDDNDDDNDVTHQRGSDSEPVEALDGMSEYTKQPNENHINESVDEDELPKIATIVTTNDCTDSARSADNVESAERRDSYTNLSQAMTSENKDECLPLTDESDEVKYAELDLKLSGPWDQIIESEERTEYAVVDHTKKKPAVRATYSAIDRTKKKPAVVCATYSAIDHTKKKPAVVCATYSAIDHTKKKPAVVCATYAVIDRTKKKPAVRVTCDV